MCASASNGAGRSGSSLRTTAAGSTRIGKSAAGGFGLLSMQERAARVGAVLSVDSVPEQGTRVAVAFR